MMDINTDEHDRRFKSSKKLSAARRYIGNMMLESLHAIRQLTPYFEVEADNLMKVKDELKKQNKNVTITSIYVRLMASILQE